jgi:hypothetical protein
VVVVVVFVGRAGHVKEYWSGKGEAGGSFQFHHRLRSNNSLTCHCGIIMINTATTASRFDYGAEFILGACLVS